MPFQLGDVTFNDAAAYAHTYISSFHSDRYSRASFAGQTSEQRIAGVISRWPKNYGEPLIVYKKVTDTDTGELVSWIKIAFENTDVDPKRFAPTDIPQELMAEIAAQPPPTPQFSNSIASSKSDFVSRAKAARAQALGNRPAIILYLFGTHPKAQRRGAGSLLMAWVTELADREGFACWVTGSPVAVPVYKRFGFEVVEEITVPLPGDNVGGETYTHTCMIREPKKPSGVA